MTTAQPLVEEEIAFRFVGWELRPRERVLRVAGQPVKIGGRAFDVLLALVQRPGRVVGRSELLDAAWPGLVVEENNLSVQISTLRKLLGPSAIVNVAGLGYRLAAAPAVDGAADPAPVVRALALIGRGADLALLRTRLGAVPLLSLVGTGGIGKTALARALLDAAPRRWRDGVHWIDLAALRPGTALLPLVARALGVLVGDAGASSAEAVRALSKFDALVVIDNCEHLLDEVGACVAPLVRAAPGLCWLATSQQPLGLIGEEVHRVAPLDVAARTASAAQAAACAALALFRERAAAADSGFTLAGAEVGMALDLCHALDGLPLALEMAAALVARLGLRSVHEQLKRRLSLTAGVRDVPARHLSLRHTYEWSWGLLSPAEQRLFCALQPFQGGFTAELARAVVPDAAAGAEGPEVLDTLAALVDKSLVHRMPSDEPGLPPRFRLLESAREFAALRLQAQAQTDTVLQLHAQAVADWFRDADAHLRVWRDRRWAERYLPESDNAGAALAWACRAGTPELLARLVAACAQLEPVAHIPLRVVQAAVPIERLLQAPPAWRGLACSEFGWAQYLDGNRELATVLLEQALRDYEANGDAAGIHFALARLIRLLRGRPGQKGRADALWARWVALDPAGIPLRQRLYGEMTVSRQFGGGRSVDGLWQLCRVAQHAGLEAQAALCRLNISDELLIRRQFDEAAQVAGVLIDDGPRWPRTYAMACHNRAHALVRLGRFDEARAPAAMMLRVLPGESHAVIDLFALAAVRSAAWEQAALLLGCSSRLRRERDWGAEPAEAALIDEAMQALRAALPGDELQRLFELGAAMSTGDMLSIAGLA